MALAIRINEIIQQSTFYRSNKAVFHKLHTSCWLFRLIKQEAETDRERWRLQGENRPAAGVTEKENMLCHKQERKQDKVLLFIPCFNLLQLSKQHFLFSLKKSFMLWRPRPLLYFVFLTARKHHLQSSPLRHLCGYQQFPPLCFSISGWSRLENSTVWGACGAISFIVGL